MKALIIAFALVSSFAQAGDRTSAYNAICKPMTFESQRAECLVKVKQFNYFDDRGLSFCAGLSFDSNKMNCLMIIGDKVYEGYEMDHCMDQTFESSKIECLKESGTTYNPDGHSCVPREEAIKQLSNSLTDLRNGNSGRADQRLSKLLERFTNCR